MVTSSLVLSCPSLAVRRRTYVPGVTKYAAEAATFGFVNVTVAGALTVVQFADILLPPGSPSSVVVPLGLTAALPIDRTGVEIKKPSFGGPVLRVPIKRTRTHPGRAGRLPG